MQPYPALETFFRHNLWANLRLLDVCSSLEEEHLQAGVVGGYGSILDTLQHLVGAERSYFSRISTGQPHSRADGPPTTFAEMAESLRLSGEGLIEWAPKISAEDRVDLQWNSDSFSGPVHVPKAVILTQAINHATEHRAQIMTILTQLGIQPPDLSSWTYFEAQGFK